MAERNVAQTFARGLLVLTHLNQHNGSTARHVAQRAGLNEVITRRLLDTLLGEGFVLKNADTGQYWLQPQIAALSSGFRDDRWITEIAEPVMKRLGRQVVWPASLVTPSGLTLTVRTNTDEYSPLTIRKTPIGTFYPLVNSASGPVYLAFCDAEERATLVDLLWTTERASLKSRYQTKAALSAHLATVRRQGYCCFNGPERLSAIAVPVSREGRAVAALSLRYFTAAMSSREAARRYFDPLTVCARHIQEGLSRMAA